MAPFRIMAHATRQWWYHFTTLILVSVVWTFLSILIVTLPLATAVLFAFSRRSYEGEYWDWQDVRNDFRQLFWPSLRWGMLNAAVIALGFFNLYFYRNAPGLGWQAMRSLWVIMLAVWLGLNLFFWPFWLAQDDKGLGLTLANCGRFWLLHPAVALICTLACSLILALSVYFVVPILLGTLPWVAFIALAAVDHALAAKRHK